MTRLNLGHIIPVKKTLTLDESLAYATGTVTSDATNPDDGGTIVIDDIIYRFKSTPNQANDIQIGANAAATLDNLKAAVNGTGTEGVEYFAGTEQPAGVTATTNTDTTQVLQAIASGFAGNSIVLTESATHLTVSGSGTLSGGGANELTEEIGGEGGMCSVIIVNAPQFTGSITLVLDILDADGDLLFESTNINENAVTRILVEQLLQPTDVIKITASAEVEESLALKVSIR